MIFGALAALAAGAAAGIFLALRHFLRKRLPVWAALLHGLGGATGFVLVLLIVVREPAFQLARQALYLLIVTVALGCVNLLFHVRKVRHRTSLIVMHALCAVSGVGTLLYAAFVPVEPAAAAQTPAPASLPPAPTAATTESAPSASGAPPPSAQAAAPVASAASQAKDVAPSAPAFSLPRTINFDSASATISPDSLAALDEAAAALTAHPDVTLVEVQGHADERGDDARNLELTRARAQAVVEALAAKGVARQRLRSAGYGSRCPADAACRSNSPPSSCHESSRYQEDRRVVFVVLRQGNTAFKGELACAQGAALVPPADRAFQAPAH